MAVYEAPVEHHDHHYASNDASTGPSSGIWAVIAVLLVLFLLLLFGSNLFGRGSSNNSTGGTNIEGSVNTPSGSGSGSVNTQ